MPEFFSSREYPWLFASQVSRDEVVGDLDALGIRQLFSVVVGGGDFGLPKKPHPAIYVKTMKLLGIAPEYGVAIEDAGNGAASAVAAGLTCVVITNEYTRVHTFPAQVITFASFEVLSRIVSESRRKRGEFISF